MDDLHANRYECIRVQLSWHDENDVPINLGGRQAMVIEAHPRLLKNAQFTITDGNQGKTELFVPDDLAATLGLGRSNWIRLGVRIPGGCLVTLPPIWINVK